MGQIGGAPSDSFATRHYDYVAATAQGFIYILDARRSRVEQFDTTGVLLNAFGRPGQQSGEFVVPQAMTIDDHGQLYVFDARLKRITEFATADSPRFTRTISLDVNATDMCAMDGSLYLFGLYRGMVVHRIGPNGEPQASFGAPFGPAESEMAQGSLSRGTLLCVPASHMVIVIPKVVPEMRAYTADGRLLWSRPIARYSATIVSMMEGGGVSLSAPPAGFHKVRSAFLASSRLGVLQLELVSNRHVTSRETRLFGLEDGRELGVSTTIPELAGARTPYVFAITTDLNPRLSIHRFEVRPGQ